ncbi:MAG: hypothetical protein C4293_10015 [Nitrospiraceae bacterium]
MARRIFPVEGEEKVLINLVPSPSMILLAVTSSAIWTNLPWLLDRLHNLRHFKLLQCREPEADLDPEIKRLAPELDGLTAAES